METLNHLMWDAELERKLSLSKIYVLTCMCISQASIGGIEWDVALTKMLTRIANYTTRWDVEISYTFQADYSSETKLRVLAVTLLAIMEEWHGENSQVEI